jgi:hypothetical protein
VNIATVRSTIGSALGAVTGLNVYSYEPDDYSSPAAVVGWPDAPINVSETFVAGRLLFQVPVRLYVARTGDDSSESLLAGYLDQSTTSAASVVSALGAGAVVKSSDVQYMLVDIRDFFVTTAALSATLTVQVIA